MGNRAWPFQTLLLWWFKGNIINTRRYRREQETRPIETNLTLIHNMEEHFNRHMSVFAIIVLQYFPIKNWHSEYSGKTSALSAFQFGFRSILGDVYLTWYSCQVLEYGCDENENLLFDFWFYLTVSSDCVQRHRSGLITKNGKIDSRSDERITVHRLGFWSLLWFPLLAAYDSGSPCANTQI